MTGANENGAGSTTTGTAAPRSMSSKGATTPPSTTAANMACRSWADKGFGASLIPVEPGQKAPARFADGRWWRFADWAAYQVQDGDPALWDTWGASVGLRTAQFPCLDIDCDDTDLAGALVAALGTYRPDAALVIRRRPNARTRLGSRAVLFRLAGEPFRKLRLKAVDPKGRRVMVDVLAQGQQVVVQGRHPDGSTYEWPEPPVAATLPPLDQPGARLLLDQLADTLRALGCTGVVVAGSEAPLAPEDDAAALARRVGRSGPAEAGDEATVRALLDLIPNDVSMDYDAWIAVCAAIRGASGGADWGRDLWHDWSSRWTEGPNEPEDLDRKWRSMRDPVLGLGYLRDLARQRNPGGAARLDFAPLPPEPGTAIDDMLAADEDDSDDTPLDGFLARVVYVQGVERYVDLHHPRTMMTVGGLDTVWRSPLHEYLPRTRGAVTPPSSYWASHPRRKLVARVNYAPGRPRMYVDTDGRRVFNRWSEAPLLAAARDAYRDGMGEAVLVRPMLDLLEHLTNGDRATAEHVIRCARFLIQHPDRKHGHGLLFTSGRQGVGKDMFVEHTFTAGAGPDNATLISNKQLNSQFNGYVENKVVVVGEIKTNTRGSITATEEYGTIKLYLGSQPPLIQVNHKHIAPYMIENLGLWLFTSNDTEYPMHLDQHDRRVYVVECLGAPLEPAFYADLVRWLHAGGQTLWLAHLLEPLTEHEIQLVTGHAPMTSAKARILQGMDPLVSWLRDAIDDWPDVMKFADVVKAVAVAAANPSTSGLTTGRGQLPEKRIMQAVRDVGGDRLLDGEQVRLPDGSRGRMWALRNPELYRGLDRDGVRDLYAEQMAAAAAAAENVMEFPKVKEARR